MRSLPAVCDQDIGEMRKKVPIVPKIRTETTLPLSPRNTVVRDFHLHESACDFVRVVHTVAQQETTICTLSFLISGDLYVLFQTMADRETRNKQAIHRRR